MIGDLITGLSVSLIGIFTVFGVLAILAAAVYLLRFIGAPHQESKGERPREAVPSRAETTPKVGIGEGSPDNDKVSMITASIIAFNEYKKRRLEKYELFRDFPSLRRLLPLAGVYFSARIRVSVGGVDKEVEVREKGANLYSVVIDGREYIVQTIVG